MVIIEKFGGFFGVDWLMLLKVLYDKYVDVILILILIFLNGDWFKVVIDGWYCNVVLNIVC